jgi:putative membrane protein
MTSVVSDHTGRVGKRSLSGLTFLGLFTLVAVAGYGVFGLHPNLIPDSDFSRRFFGASFTLFARGHIVVAGLTLAWFLTREVSWRWIPALLAVAVASFLSEHIGTGYGFPFGGYEYTGLLGYKLGGRVPALIPASWFLMALPSWVLARTVFPTSGGSIWRIAFGAYLLTAWDLVLDPAMSFLVPYWTWASPGPFYGMPWVNLAGWLGTGMVLMFLLEVFGARSWARDLSTNWLWAFYGVNLALPAGMLLAAGVWFPVLVAGIAVGAPFALARALPGRGFLASGVHAGEGAS